MYKFILVSLLSCFLVPSVQAAQWSLSGTLNPSLEYDDNIFMRVDDKLGDYHSNISPTLSATHKLENIDTTLSIGYVIDRYQDTSELNTENPFWRFNTGYQTQRSHWGLAVSYAESTSRSDAAGDTGDFETNSISIRESISPSFSYQLTERDVLSINASYSTAEFSTTDFSNSRSRSLTTNWSHKFTERLNGGISLSASNNKSSGLISSSDDDTYNLSLTSRYELSEIWSINGSVGIRQLDGELTDAFGVIDKNTSTGESLDLSVSYKNGLDTASLGLSRSISPSSSGDVNETDKLSMSWSRGLSEVLSASINASIQQTTSARDDGSDKRDNISVSPAVNWKFLPNASLSLSYKYRQQKESELDTNATSNAVMLTLNYDWDGVSISR